MTSRGRKSNLLPKPKVREPLTIKQPKLVRKMAANVSSQFTDALMIQENNAMFFLSFLQTQFPFVVTPEEMREVKEVEQLCVAQLIVSPEQMARNLRILNGNFNGFIEAQSPENQKRLRYLLNGKNITDSISEEDENS